MPVIRSLFVCAWCVCLFECTVYVCASTSPSWYFCASICVHIWRWISVLFMCVRVQVCVRVSWLFIFEFPMLPAQGKSSLNDSCCRHRHQAAEFLNFFLNHYPKLFLSKCRRRRKRKKKNETKDVLVWIWRLRFNSLPARRDSTSHLLADVSISSLCAKSSIFNGRRGIKFNFKQRD